MYKISTDCKVVIGVTRSAIYDFIRRTIHFVPNELALELELVSKTKNKDSFLASKNPIYHEFLSYLLENEILFDFPEENLFIPFSKEIRTSVDIENAVLKITSSKKLNVSPIIDFLKKYGIEYLCIDVDNFVDLKSLKNFINECRNTKIKSITLSTNEKSIIARNLKFFTEVDFIQTIIHHSQHKIYDPKIHFKTALLWSKIRPFDINTSKISLDLLNIDYTNYLISENENLFYFKKIFLNQDGLIFKNISYKDVLSNVEDENFISKYNLNYKNLNISKENIVDCKDCEFRRLCPDDRIPVKEGKKYKHNTKCNYDPIKNTWFNL